MKKFDRAVGFIRTMLCGVGLFSTTLVVAFYLGYVHGR